MGKIINLARAATVDIEPLSVQPISDEVLAIGKRGGLFGLGEAYVDGKFESQDLEGLLLAFAESPHAKRASWTGAMWRLFLEGALKNTQVGARAFEVARHHYDLGNDLFRVMLDPSMSYTSGLFEGETTTLAAAQEAKLRRLCQKLRLAPGMRVLDIGCGWGNFALFAASHYGVEVTGLTVSEEQLRYIEGVKGQLPIDILLCDYNKFNPGKPFDRIVSIEMIEAVGKKNLNGYFASVSRSLKPGGRFALQAICGDTFNRYSQPALNQFILWLMKNIFPNGYIPNLEELIRPARGEFVLESLSELPGSYERTLRAWNDNFNAGFSDLAAKYSPRFKRMWNFYLLGCAAMFVSRLVQVHHLVFIKR